MVKRSRATERKEKREGRESRRGADWGREGGKKVFAEVVLDESKPPSVFSPRPLLIARFIRAEKPFLDHVPTFLLSAHPCPSTLPFIINCFVRSLLCETSFKSGRNAIREIYPPEEKFNLDCKILKEVGFENLVWIWIGCIIGLGEIKKNWKEVYVLISDCFQFSSRRARINKEEF